jgi:ABC-type branched-subunit amino acid transport system substrate-binding protein
MTVRDSVKVAAAVLAVGLVLCGCPRRFDPAAAPALTSPDQGVNDKFAEARRLHDAGKLDHAERAFAELVRTHPDDPLAAAASLYRGRIALQQGKPEDAKQLLSPLAGSSDTDAVATQARYHLGIALVRLGEHQKGRQLLQPFLQRVAEKDRPALLAALGHAARELGDPMAATAHLDELHHVTSRPVERLHARSSLEAILGGSLPVAKLRAIYNAARTNGLLAALAGQRLARAEAAAGNAAEAARILAATADARERYKIRSSPPGGAGLQTKLVGLLVPLTGRYRAAGREVLRGAVEASSALRDGTLALAVRDSGKAPAAATRQLVKEGAVALVGTLDPKTTRAVANAASSAGIPFVALSRVRAHAGAAAPMQMLPENQTRAGALAQSAIRSGSKRLATLAPATAYGRAMVAAFEKRARALGAKIVVKLTYPAKTKEFSKQAAALAKAQFDALFIPDRAHVFSLVAPALAKAGLWSASRPGKRSKHRRVLLLSTADGLTARLVNASRYIQGAVLAPGFYPDDGAPKAGALIRRYRDSQGSAPSLVAALAFDAVELIRVARERGARSRAEIRAALVGGRAVLGLTGAIRFDKNGQRADPPLLYRVEGEQIKQIESPAR